MFSFTNQKRWPEEAEAQASKINSKGLDLFLAEYMRMISKGWPHRKKVASPGQPSIDRKWWDKFNNFVSTRAQNAKQMFFAENTFVLAKGCNHIYQLHQPNKVTWRGRGAGVKNKFQGARPFLAEYMLMIFKGWPHRKKVASPGQPSIDRKWWDKFNNFVSTWAQNAKHCFFAEHTFVLAKGYNHICSASPTKKVTWRGRGAGVKNKFQGAGPFLALYTLMIFKGWPNRKKSHHQANHP